LAADAVCRSCPPVSCHSSTAPSHAPAASIVILPVIPHFAHRANWGACILHRSFCRSTHAESASQRGVDSAENRIFDRMTPLKCKTFQRQSGLRRGPSPTKYFKQESPAPTHMRRANTRPRPVLAGVLAIAASSSGREDCKDPQARPVRAACGSGKLSRLGKAHF